MLILKTTNQQPTISNRYMEISGSPFPQGDQIYEWANGFTTEVAHLANNRLSNWEIYMTHSGSDSRNWKFSLG